MSDLDRYRDFLRQAGKTARTRREYHPTTRPQLVAFHVRVEGSPIVALFDPEGHFVEHIALRD